MDYIENKKLSVIIHCSDGWDRTAQLSGLAQMLLDPYYRTIDGLCILIEKEWLAFGHKFAQRVGHGSGEHSDDQRAPIFVQFIDCVWQLTQQFPKAFQFNDELLITILDHVFSCKFGTFLFNNEKERMNLLVMEEKEKEKEKSSTATPKNPTNNITTRTGSLWHFVFSRITDFTNQNYQPVSESLFPVVSMKNLQLWTKFFLRYNGHVKINK